MHAIVTCKRKIGDTVFLNITLWELSVAMETRVLIRSGPKPNAAFPHPNDASDKNLIAMGLLVAKIFRSESVDGHTEAHKDGRTPARLPFYKLTL